MAYRGNVSKVILLIEDNVDDERLTLRALRRNNIMNEVVVAADGQSGLDYLYCEGEYVGRTPDSFPAVVILDLKLPRKDGLEVLRRIRSDERSQHLPVVVLTANENQEQIDECYRLGANSYVHKPGDAEEFSEMVLQLAMYWLLLNRLPNERVAV